MKQGSATNAQLLQLVELLSDDDEIERARACREALHTKFCLTERTCYHSQSLSCKQCTNKICLMHLEDWLSWLDDELAFHEVRAQTASNEDTVRSLDHILSLFQRATHDYECKYSSLHLQRLLISFISWFDIIEQFTSILTFCSA